MLVTTQRQIQVFLLNESFQIIQFVIKEQNNIIEEMGSVIMTVSETNDMIKVDTSRGIRSTKQSFSRCSFQSRPQYQTATSIMEIYSKKRFTKFKGDQQMSKIQCAQTQSLVDNLLTENQKNIIQNEGPTNSNSCQFKELEHQTNDFQKIGSNLQAQTLNFKKGSSKPNQDQNTRMKQNLKTEEKIELKGSHLKAKKSSALNIIQEDEQESKAINYQKQNQLNDIQPQEVNDSQELSNSKLNLQTQKSSHIFQKFERQNVNITDTSAIKHGNHLEKSNIIIKEKQQQYQQDLPNSVTPSLKQEDKQNQIIAETQPQLVRANINIINKSLIKRQSHAKADQSAKINKKTVKGNRTNNNISVVYSDTIEKSNSKIMEHGRQSNKLVHDQGQIQSSPMDIEEYQKRNEAEKIKLEQNKRKREQKKIAEQKRRASQLKKIQDFKKKIKEEGKKKLDIESGQLRKIYNL